MASIHMLVFTVGIGLGVFGLTFTGLGLFAELDLWTSLLVAFALSFSSTVFAVKVLEGWAEMESRHGHEAIGVLIMQDLFAILFLTASMGKLPSPWALLLLGLPLLRFPLKMVFERVPDEVEQLREAGVDAAHYLHDEMGIGLARSALAEINSDTLVDAPPTSSNSGSPGATPQRG